MKGRGGGTEKRYLFFECRRYIRASKCKLFSPFLAGRLCLTMCACEEYNLSTRERHREGKERERKCTSSKVYNASTNVLTDYVKDTSTPSFVRRSIMQFY